MPDSVARDIITLGAVATFVGDDARRKKFPSEVALVPVSSRTRF
jgi:hypothetical protein